MGTVTIFVIGSKAPLVKVHVPKQGKDKGEKICWFCNRSNSDIRSKMFSKYFHSSCLREIYKADPDHLEIQLLIEEMEDERDKNL